MKRLAKLTTDFETTFGRHFDCWTNFSGMARFTKRFVQ